MRVYAYLRASTVEQDALRAKQQLIDFASSKDKQISAFFIENESGSTLERPELFKLLDIAQANDVILLEQVDRLSRLNAADWDKLRSIIKSKSICVVALDLPTSHAILTTTQTDEFTLRMMSAINDMLLDMLAAIARKDYEDRRRRQAQGIEKAKAGGKFKGRPTNTEKNEKISKLLDLGWSYSEIEKTLNVSRPTIAKIRKQKNNSGQL